MDVDDEVLFSVRVRSELRALGSCSVQLSRVVGWGSVGVFCALTVVTALATGDALQNPSRRDPGTGLALTVFFALLTGLGVFLVLRSRRASAQRRLLESEIALTLTTTTLEFPEVPGHRAAESWPLQRTRTVCRPGPHGFLAFTAPDREARQILQRWIEPDVEEVHRRVLAAQRLLHGDQP